MSPDLSNTWHQEPDGLELNFDDCEDGNEHENDGSYEEFDSDAEKGAKDHISDVRESSLWVSLRDCLTPADVLVLRTAGSKWKNAKLYGTFAALWFFLMTKSGGEEASPAPLPEWPSPVCALCIFRISASIMGCSSQDGCRT